MPSIGVANDSSGGASTLEVLAREYFQSVYRAHPTLATVIGVHTYDDRLDDFSRDALDAQASRTREFLGRLRALDAGALGPHEVIDWRLLESNLLMALHHHEVTQDWRRNPGIYVDWPLVALLLQLTRDYAPLPERLAAVAARLDAFGGLLAVARQNLENPPRVFTEVAIESTAGAVSFLDETIAEVADSAPAEVAPSLLASRERALTACRDYLAWLRDDLLPRSNGSFAVGREAFAELLKTEYMLDYPIEEIAATGRRVFDETRVALEALAAEIAPGKGWPEIVAEARREHPSADGLLDAYRREMANLKAFILERSLAAVPANERLDVIATPAFARSTTPYAAYMPPAPFEEDQRGQFWVTPVDPTLPVDELEDLLGEHCWPSLASTALHEAYPGHHLQLVCANNQSDFVRKHAESSLLCEGWALYCEQMVGEQGYVPVGLEHGDARLFRLFLLKDQLWRAARVLIDVGLHTGGMSIDEAVRLLVDEVRLAEPMARVEVNRYTMTPTQPLSYMLGKLEILRLREDLRWLPLGLFHNRLLTSGSIPLKLVRAEMLGA